MHIFCFDLNQHYSCWVGIFFFCCSSKVSVFVQDAVVALPHRHACK